MCSDGQEKRVLLTFFLAQVCLAIAMITESGKMGVDKLETSMFASAATRHLIVSLPIASPGIHFSQLK